MSPMAWMLAAVDKLRATLCVWIGHSRCVTNCFGYKYCARCGAQVGDSLGAGVRSDLVHVGAAAHEDCAKCDELAADLTWRDTLLLPRDKRPRRAA